MSLKGSKKCVLDLVQSKDFLSTIKNLCNNTNATISEYDNWMPKNMYMEKEAELKDFLKYNFDISLYDEIVQWWLHVDATTPNWDLISTCTINNKRALLLVEAKAHWDELENESKGKSLNKNASLNSNLNHEKIGEAIKQANVEINKRINGVSISRDTCYQLSNRVAHAWWLANQGIPVVLMYLGFNNVIDMDDGKNRLFVSYKDWDNCFIEHAKKVGVDKIIDRWVDCGKSEFITICRSL